VWKVALRLRFRRRILDSADLGSRDHDHLTLANNLILEQGEGCR
jgi:hypothetical protein